MLCYSVDFGQLYRHISNVVMSGFVDILPHKCIVAQVPLISKCLKISETSSFPYTAIQSSYFRSCIGNPSVLLNTNIILFDTLLRYKARYLCSLTLGFRRELSFRCLFPLFSRLSINVFYCSPLQVFFRMLYAVDVSFAHSRRYCWVEVFLVEVRG